MMRETQRLLQHALGGYENAVMTATFAKEMRKKYHPKKHVEEKDEPIKKPPNPLLDGLKAMAG